MLDERCFPSLVVRRGAGLCLSAVSVHSVWGRALVLPHLSSKCFQCLGGQSVRVPFRNWLCFLGGMGGLVGLSSSNVATL